MQHISTEQQRPGEKPALAPNATQNTPKAQAKATIPIPTFKHPRRRHKDTNAESWRDGSETEADEIRIRDWCASSASLYRPTAVLPLLSLQDQWDIVVCAGEYIQSSVVGCG